MARAVWHVVLMIRRPGKVEGVRGGRIAPDQGLGHSDHAGLSQLLSRWAGGTDQDVVNRLGRAARRRPLHLETVVPSKTRAVSVTGAVCQQRCAHCNGHYLRGMQPLDALESAGMAGVDSLLISGGSLVHGEVPLADHLDRLLALPPDLPLNLHVGLQDGERLRPLRGRPVTVSFDLVGDDATAREVYRLNRPARDWLEAYERLQELFPVIPHLTIGLRGGMVSGERVVLDYLSRHPPPALTFLVFRPTPGTAFAGRPAPAPSVVAELIAEAAERLDCPLHLGCMRPAGAWRRRADRLAWLAGARTIVMPDRALVADLQEAGIPVTTRQECCSLDRRGPEQADG